MMNAGSFFQDQHLRPTPHGGYKRNPLYTFLVGV